MASFIPLNTKPLRRIARVIRVAALAALLAPAGCAYWAAPIEGRVVDADTGDPVEDVAIAAVWGVMGGIEGGVPQCPVGLEDAVTGPEGRYRIEGWGPRLPGGSIERSAPVLYYYKDGYRLEIESTKRRGHHGDVPLRIKSDQDRETIALERYEGGEGDDDNALHGLGDPVIVKPGCECSWENIPRYTTQLLERSRNGSERAFTNYVNILRGDGDGSQCSDPLKLLQANGGSGREE